MGVPFRSRLKGTSGLTFPKAVELVPNFVCEVCTVRSVLDREILLYPADLSLIMLERARLIDIVNKWAPGTHAMYQLRIKSLRSFADHYGLRRMKPPPLIRPADSRSIPIMWLQQQWALRPGQKRGGVDDGQSVSYNTARALRAGIGQFYSYDLQGSDMERVMLDRRHNAVLKVPGCLPTATLAYTYMAEGMSRRLGDQSRPSVALLDRHIRWIDNFLDGAFRNPGSVAHKIDVCTAAACNLILWLGWLRSLECMSLTWDDCTLIRPGRGAKYDIPRSVGAILLRLLAQTKASRRLTADVLIAFTTGSGYSLGTWLIRLHELREQDSGQIDGSSFLLADQEGNAWTSLLYRSNYLYPLLHMQRLAGDKHLEPYDGSQGNVLEDNFYSLHCYRRGSDSHVSKKRPFCARKATSDEIFEHGRWRRKRDSMNMPQLYREWSFFDRLGITLFCH